MSANFFGKSLGWDLHVLEARPLFPKIPIVSLRKVAQGSDTLLSGSSEFFFLRFWQIRGNFLPEIYYFDNIRHYFSPLKLVNFRKR